MAKELSNTIYDVTVSEAVNHVLPMVLKIGTDQDDTVRETFVGELEKIILYYYKVKTDTKRRKGKLWDRTLY